MVSTLIVGLLIGIFIITTSMRTVPQGQVFIKMRLGREAGTLKPGLHFLVPFIETTIRQSTAPEESQFSVGKIRVTVAYQVKDAAALMQNVADFNSALKVGAESRLKKHLNEELNASSIELSRIESEFQRDLADLFAPWGVEVQNARLSV